MCVWVRGGWDGELKWGWGPGGQAEQIAWMRIDVRLGQQWDGWISGGLAALYHLGHLKNGLHQRPCPHTPPTPTRAGQLFLTMLCAMKEFIFVFFASWNLASPQQSCAAVACYGSALECGSSSSSRHAGRARQVGRPPNYYPCVALPGGHPVCGLLCHRDQGRPAGGDVSTPWPPRAGASGVLPGLSAACQVPQCAALP